jgi:hypothetical protein
MVLEGNFASQEFKRDVHYAITWVMTDIDEQGGSPCIVVSSASGDVVDTWGAVKMLRRLCKIKRLRLRSPIVNAHPDPFYDNVNHQLIGVGYKDHLVTV